VAQAATGILSRCTGRRPYHDGREGREDHENTPKNAFELRGLRDHRALARDSPFVRWPVESYRLTLPARYSIPRSVATFSSRLSAILMTVVLAGGHVAVAGWMATPDARMACCADGGACPMHESDSHAADSTRVITQAEADSCCAASEQAGSAASESVFVLSVSLASVSSPISFVLPAAPSRPDAWRALEPVPGAHVPRHLLLSVLLV
jgi:hypothetical protein